MVFSFPPALDTFGIQYGVFDNPVQVLFNAGVFVTGVTYYARATNAQTLEIRATINPSDPTLDCSVFSFGQVAFAYVSGTSPSSIQTLLLSNGLEITTDTQFSAVYSDSLVVQDLTNVRQALTYAFKSVYQDNTEGTSTTISAPTASDNNVFYASGKTSNVLIEVDTPKITTTNGSDVSVLSATDLTFNGVTYSRDLKVKQTNTILQNISPAIYADGRPPTAPTATFINSYAYTPSWYFKNTVAGYKINWYAGPYAGMTVADLLGMYMYMFNGLTTSNDNTPFLTVYTQPQAGDPTFYHSRRTYIFNQEVTPVANTRYCLFANISGDCPTPAYYGQTLNVMITGTVVGTNVGPFDPSELILFFSIGSNSASAVNSVEFAVSKLGIMTPNGTQEFAYIPL